MEEDFFTETIEVTDYDNLVNVIKGKTDKCGDLRNKFVFRGVEDCEFKLVPSALREDDINDYVNENFKVTLRCPIEEVEEYGFEVEMLEFPDDLISIPLNKYFERVEEDTFEYIFSKSEFQFRKELDALLNFLDYGDKVGLKIPINQKIRKLIDRKIGKTF